VLLISHCYPKWQVGIIEVYVVLTHILSIHMYGGETASFLWQLVQEHILPLDIYVDT
jgi:hypothetical protein